MKKKLRWLASVFCILVVLTQLPELGLEQLWSLMEEYDAGSVEVGAEKPAAETVQQKAAFDFESIPVYSGEAYIEVNDNIPFFEEADLEKAVLSYESYAPLDDLDRCGVCIASIGTDIMPTEQRGDIGSVKPSGWNQAEYPKLVSGTYLYNRCHLIGHQLTGENANERNLITGTRYLNIEGMLPFENMTADYVQETGNHVLYRVTPIFQDDDLVARGVLMEAISVEDDGEGILFCVYCYNVQPGISIDYSNGASQIAEQQVSYGYIIDIIDWKRYQRIAA